MSSSESESTPKEEGTITNLGGNELITKGFEAMWYQAEVLHKRTQDKLDILEKVLKTQTEQLEKLEGVLKDRIMMFSQDIIATMKEMKAVEQERMNLLVSYLLPPAPIAPEPQTPIEDTEEEEKNEKDDSILA